MTGTTIRADEVRTQLIARREIALIDLRPEACFALGHPLFAAQLPVDRIAVEFSQRVPRLSCSVVLYDDGEGLVEQALPMLNRLGYTEVRVLEGGLSGWRQAGYELFEDVNSYCKAFGELVEHRRKTPSLPAKDLKKLVDSGERIVILDARRFDEYATMAIPGGISVPGAELVLRARALAPDPNTRIVVNCAGRTRSFIGAQSLINAGIPNRVDALRNGTIGWSLAGLELATGSSSKFSQVPDEVRSQARNDARGVAYRAGVREINLALLAELSADPGRTLYQFDVRTPEEFEAGHLPGFVHVPGGQLVQETDMSAPTRGARIVLADDVAVRAHMTASWLAQMGWDVYVLSEWDHATLVEGAGKTPPPRGVEGRYKRPYEGTTNPAEAMQNYLDWEYGLVRQLERDGTHGFVVI